MKAYAVFCAGYYLISYAQSSARAKAMVFVQAIEANFDTRDIFRSLRCRRWPALDDGGSQERVEYWGYPGERTIASGGRPIALPEPFARGRL